jgi:hypothetical protein
VKDKAAATWQRNKAAAEVEKLGPGGMG